MTMLKGSVRVAAGQGSDPSQIREGIHDAVSVMLEKMRQSDPTCYDPGNAFTVTINRWKTGDPVKATPQEDEKAWLAQASSLRPV